MADRAELVSPHETTPDPVINLQKDSEDYYVTEVKRLKAKTYLVLILLLVLIVCGGVFIAAELFVNEINQYNTIPEYVQTIVFAVVMVAAILVAYYGMFFTHRYGGASQQIKILEDQGKVLEEANNELDAQATNLTNSVVQLKDLTNNTVSSTQNKLNDVIKDGEEIGRIGRAITENNEQTAEFFNDIEEILELTHTLKRQIGKNQLMQIFYELESMDDGQDGLNRTEYNHFMEKLDKDTADAFREVTTFNKMDRNRNGIIDVWEFEDVLNEVFDNLDKKDRANTTRFALDEDEVEF